MAGGGADFERLLDELLKAHLTQFQAARTRARADAAPSLLGAERGTDHYTFSYARRSIDDCLGNVNRLMVHFAADQGREPAALEPLARAGVRGFLDAVFSALAREFDGPPPGEFGLKPSREALTQVRSYAEAMAAAALAAGSRGRLDARLARKPGALAVISDRLGGSQRLILIVAAVGVVLMVIWSL